VYLGSFPGVKRPERHGIHSPPTSTKIQSKWRYTSSHSTCLYGCGTNSSIIPLLLLYDDRFLRHPFHFLLSVFAVCDATRSPPLTVLLIRIQRKIYQHPLSLFSCTSALRRRKQHSPSTSHIQALPVHILQPLLRCAHSSKLNKQRHIVWIIKQANFTNTVQNILKMVSKDYTFTETSVTITAL
jgi:hypothetical protein